MWCDAVELVESVALHLLETGHQETFKLKAPVGLKSPGAALAFYKGSFLCPGINTHKCTFDSTLRTKCFLFSPVFLGLLHHCIKDERPKNILVQVFAIYIFL